MICPDCKTDNIAGADFCESCGHDLHSLDLPQAEDEFTEHLINDSLGDIEAAEPLIVSPREPLAFAIHRMQSGGAPCALVMEGERLAGILTERDVLLKAADERADLNALAIGQVMTPDPITLRAEDSLAAALHKMSVGGFRHIPVTRDGRVTGVVSVVDVFRHVSRFVHKQPITAP
jgi:CBS domain-containing protein